MIGNEVSDRRGDLAAVGGRLRERNRSVVGRIPLAREGHW